MELLVAVVVSLLVGAAAGLKIIAPRTQTKKDDRVLEILEVLVARGTPLILPKQK